jgi:PleD family two-component response regulator
MVRGRRLPVFILAAAGAPDVRQPSPTTKSKDDLHEHDSEKGTVYVVDDDEAVRDSLQWLLEGKDYRVRCFESAEAFLPATTRAKSPA